MSVVSRQRETLFAEILEHHRGIVVKVARSFAVEPADLDDLLQEIMIRLWKSLDGFRGDAKLSTWMYRVALNTALTWQRSEARRQQHQDPMATIIDLPGTDQPGTDNAEDSARLSRLYDHIRELPEIDRALVVLSLDGLSYAEMSEVVGISESNVGARLTRARAKLRTSLKEVSDER